MYWLLCVLLQEHINQLIAEREAWIEEMQSQRAEATGVCLPPLQPMCLLAAALAG